METRPPDVTIVVPTKNRWHLLGPVLESALAQEDVEAEVIVIDDGSRTDAPSDLRALSAPGVRLVRHETSLGVARARNRGIAEAGGQWVAFLDDDDIWAPRKLRLQLDAAAEIGAAFGYTGVLALNERWELVTVAPAPDPDELDKQLLHQQVIPAGASNIIARTDLVRSLGGFDERLSQLADWDLWLRLAYAAQAAACPEYLVGWVKHPANMLLTKRQSIFAELEYLAEKHEAASARLGVQFDRIGFVRWVASGHGRAGRRFQAAVLYAKCGWHEGDPRDFGRALRVLANPGPMKMRRRRVTADIDTEWIERLRDRGERRDERLARVGA